MYLYNNRSLHPSGRVRLSKRLLSGPYATIPVTLSLIAIAIAMVTLLAYSPQVFVMIDTVTGERIAEWTSCFRVVHPKTIALA